MNNDIVIRNGNVKRAYLKTTGIVRFYGIMIAVLLAAIAAIWIFSLRLTVDMKGFCAPFQKNVIFYYPVDIADIVHIGDDIRVGNAKGKIMFLNENYITVDTLENSPDEVAVEFMNSDYFDYDETYLSGIVQFDSEIVEDNEYHLILNEISIGEYIYEWAKATIGIG